MSIKKFTESLGDKNPVKFTVLDINKFIDVYKTFVTKQKPHSYLCFKLSYMTYKVDIYFYKNNDSISINSSGDIFSHQLFNEIKSFEAIVNGEIVSIPLEHVMSECVYSEIDEYNIKFNKYFKL